MTKEEGCAYFHDDSAGPEFISSNPAATWDICAATCMADDNCESVVWLESVPDCALYKARIRNVYKYYSKIVHNCDTKSNTNTNPILRHLSALKIRHVLSRILLEDENVMMSANVSRFIVMFALNMGTHLMKGALIVLMTISMLVLVLLISLHTKLVPLYVLILLAVLPLPITANTTVVLIFHQQSPLISLRMDPPVPDQCFVF